MGPRQVCAGVNKLDGSSRFVRNDHVPGTALRALHVFIDLTFIKWNSFINLPLTDKKIEIQRVWKFAQGPRASLMAQW